ncbi:DNA polymerase Y family protein [Actinoalloteichus spitiensis]|uniref:DNA polymerase Y family protein n=1 Tax=Actinoalloteichus spitiensis TaxID=252394 RepID=UPI000369BDE2|nr:DNA polymerase Y family protein [Actinoalloteichus spitiensis]
MAGGGVGSRARAGGGSTGGRSGGPPRLLVLWCPDWPVVAAVRELGLSPLDPVAVFSANRVRACSSAARAAGVRRGLRRREAQARCADLVVVADDQGRDAREFEAVAVAVERVAVGVEVVRPGLLTLPVSGPASYFGGEERAGERIVDAVSVDTGLECQVGVADGLFAAALAARYGAVVPAGESGRFLAPLPVTELARATELTGVGADGSCVALVDLVRRLGLRTVGDFAALPSDRVSSRFGAEATRVHRLARGREERPPSPRRPPADLAIEEELDPPVDRVDTAAFVARTLAERLHVGLTAHGLACTRLAITAVTENGEELTRTWRCAEPLTVAGTADRVRWQLDGWLRAPPGERPTAGVRLLRLAPAETSPAGDFPRELWDVGGGSRQLDERAERALVRVRGMVGPDGVLAAVLGGGRGPAERVRLVPWGDPLEPRHDPGAPWPGQLPPPSPTVVPVPPTPAGLRTTAGEPVGVTGRYVLTGAPAVLVVEGEREREVVGWAGPWPVEQRWWSDDGGREARLQLVALAPEGEGGVGPSNGQDHGRGQEAFLLVRSGGAWFVEGRYE